MQRLIQSAACALPNHVCAQLAMDEIGEVHQSATAAGTQADFQTDTFSQ